MEGAITVKLAVYPGSFDPVTNGHIDILEKSSKIFDEIIVAVIHNVTKKALFSLDERVKLIEESTRHLNNVRVDAFSGLLANYLADKQACAIIRGLLPDVDTMFFMSDSQYTFISSSAVKEAALLGGDVGSLVPPVVKTGLEEKMMNDG